MENVLGSPCHQREVVSDLDLGFIYLYTKMLDGDYIGGVGLGADEGMSLGANEGRWLGE